MSPLPFCPVFSAKVSHSQLLVTANTHVDMCLSHSYNLGLTLSIRKSLKLFPLVKAFDTTTYQLVIRRNANKLPPEKFSKAFGI